MRHYFAAWTDSGCLLGCDHEHQTIASAVACIPCAGGYVVAVEDGTLHGLNDNEVMEFQAAMYGASEAKRVVPPNGLKWIEET